MNKPLGLRVAALLLVAVCGPAAAVGLTEPGGIIDGLKVGGAIRFNYVYKDWDKNYDGKGKFDFDTARLDLDYDKDQWLGSLQYRYYKYRHGGMTHFLHHGWLGYRTTETSQIQVGVNENPFGLLPFASNNFFESIAYYVGLEDAFNLGIKYVRQDGNLNTQVGFYPRDGGDYRGDSKHSARYTFNIVPEGPQHNEERNTFIARTAYTFQHAEKWSTELGVSLLAGQLHNRDTDDDGTRRAGALHLKGTYGQWGLMLEAIRYDNRPENPAGQDSRIVQMGAFDFPFDVAAKGKIYLANLSYRIPRNFGPISGITLYNDYSRLDKDADGFANSQQNVLGVSFSVDKFFIMVDYMRGKQQPYMTPNFSTGLAAGGSDDSWHTRFNVNVGYYF